ncbi:MAG: porin family protein [Sphingobacteriaceae bacterium]|nr:porin family protein [Sphingobacteriaceae bacterium]
MKKIHILITIFLLSSSLVFAQKINEGTFSKIKIGALSRINKSDNNTIGDEGGNEISYIHNYFINPHFSVGVGAGIIGYLNPTVSTVPIFANATYHVFKEGSSPYLYSNLGYSIWLAENQNGSVFTELGLGLKFKVGKKLKIAPELGYRYQRFEYDFGELGKLSDYLSSLSIGVSFYF